MGTIAKSRDVLVREYLKQQSEMINVNEDFTDSLTQDGQINVHHSGTLTTINRQDDTEHLNEFKEQVKNWLRLDNEINAINSKIKMLDNEKKHRKKLLNELSSRILKFMGNNEIDELNSKDGIIKYKKSYVKEPLTHKTIISKLKTQFNNSEDAIDKINRVFKDRGKIEKIGLKRT